MKLDTEFFKLPLRFDVKRLNEEISQFTESEWRAHPHGYAGNTAISLIGVKGQADNDSPRGAMFPTPHLSRCPYLRQVLASFGAVLGRTRLMRIAGEGDASAHIDTNYYWINRVRIHVPILTYPEVKYICNGKVVNMAAGETWIFNTWRMHNSVNPTPNPRIHLVADTVGSPAFWDLVAKSERPFGTAPVTPAIPRVVPFVPGQSPQLQTEQENFPLVMTPEEQAFHVKWILDECAQSKRAPAAGVAKLTSILQSLQVQWQDAWAQYGTRPEGWPRFGQLLDAAKAQVEPLENTVLLPNGMDSVEMILQALIRPALNTDLAGEVPQPAPKSAAIPAASTPAAPPAAPLPSAPQAGQTSSSAGQGLRFDRPIFIVAAPRSGSTMLFEALARSPSVWTIGGESHQLFEQFQKLNPATRQFDSNRLTEADADPQITRAVKQGFLQALRDRENRKFSPDAQNVRMLEKTPKNALRIPFLNAMFPNALFVYLYRDPAENISSIMDAWRSGRFVTYPVLPDWPGLQWSLLLTPNWRRLRGKPIEEIAAEQWRLTNDIIMDDLAHLAPERVCSVRYSDFVADPQTHSKRICNFAGLEWDQSLSGALPNSRYTLTAPDPQKWRKNATEIERVLKDTEQVAARALDVLSGKHPVAQTSKPAAAGANVAADTVGPETDTPPFNSVHTTSFPPLLEQLGISLLVSTYQAGKLIAVRSLNQSLNTHFTNFLSPMGLAGDNARLAVGTHHEVWEFRNQPDVGRKLEPAGKVDACFLPRVVYSTGDIRIHEIAWSGDELWIVNTRFSCLCTLDRVHSFVPRWRPSFITGYSPDDRCHLNGMALVNERPKYVTALGRTDDSDGWRQNKANGGILIDVPSGEIMATGLSMPHSPRWYGGKLWLLESGHGRLSTVDEKTGKLQTVVELPGFTRGIDFFGPYAFIGLSQVRETAVFSGIPITEKPTKDRNCGVWAVDLRSGQVVAFLRFEGSVQEIFAVQVLQGIRCPDIINDNVELLGNSFVLPDDALKLVQRRAVAAAG